jgi:RNA polymerase sigma-70 factor (ECF subfamily)
MVWSICRRHLFNHQDAEDAFQATFVVLARRAPHISRRELLANWLFGVAHRVARRARAVASRRSSRESQCLEMAQWVAAAPQIDPNVKRVVHEEIHHLPAKYRAPVLLCYLENRTHEEAARELRCPLGTVKGRLSRALERLRTRLVRRGLTLSVGTVAAALSLSAAEAAVPATLAATTAQLGVCLVSGVSAGGAGLPPQIAALAKGIGSPLLGPLSWLVSGLLALVLVGGAIVWFAGHADSSVTSDGDRPSAPRPVGLAKAERPKAPQGDNALLQGTWVPVSVLVDGKEIPQDGHDLRFVFAGDRVTTRLAGMNSAEYSFTLDSGRRPKTIDLTVLTMPLKDKVFRCAYELDGDTLKICFPGEDGQRPPEIASRPNTGVVLITLQRKSK